MHSDANSYQIGGRHYKSPYEHWDYVVDINLEYLGANATKYLARCGKKEGATLLDLQKALHYSVKIEEKIKVLAPRIIASQPPLTFIANRTLQFLDANDIKAYDARFAIQFLAAGAFVSLHSTSPAQDCIKRLIAAHSVKPVPLEDSNKHADRSET